MSIRLFLTLVAAALLSPPSLAGGAQETPADRVTLEEFKKLLAGDRPVLTLDVRGGQIGSKIKGAKHVPLDALEARLGELPRDREIVTYCA
jgi:rhodanese-related sulfurtransferase